MAESTESGEEDEKSGFLASLPDDVLAIISRSLAPADLCNLGLACRSLRHLAASDKLWLPQCDRLRLLAPPRRLLAWRPAFSSYKSLARFLFLTRPLLGLWVHQNPELGNVVFAFFGFASLLACRVIPQEVPHGDASPLLWAPVFEIVARPDGSPLLFLHGRHSDADYLHPGTLAPFHPDPNLLLLEVGTTAAAASLPPPPPPPPRPRLLRSRSQLVSVPSAACAIRRSGSTISRSLPEADTKDVVSFGRLPFGDRRRLLELVADLARVKASGRLAGPLILPGEKHGDEAAGRLLSDRRLALVGLLDKCSPVRIDDVAGRLDVRLPPVKVLSSVEEEDAGEGVDSRQQVRRSRSMGSRLRNRLVQIIRRTGLMGSGAGRTRNGDGDGSLFLKNGCSTTSERKHAQLHEFLKVSSTVELRLRASKVKLSTYRAWPNMHNNKFALYKLPLQAVSSDREYAGLWGGAFGWPPDRSSSEDKSGKALFFVLLSYEECDGKRNLIGTKILEGTHYVLHPNGSAMFVVKLDEPCWDPFPFLSEGGKAGQPVEIKCAYNGDGIANGYGFRYPGSKPGSLFVTECGLLVFVWRESRSVLALQRLDLEEMLRKGEKVPPLPPIANFAYLTKSYSNVFTSISSAIHPLSSARDIERTAGTTSRMKL